MKHLIAALLLCVGCSSPTPTPVPTVAPTPTTAATVTPAWYEGGTLHDSSVAEWRTATEVNQRATAADWAAGGFDLNTVARLEEMTPKLLDCIGAGLDGYAGAYGEDAPMLDLATTCVAGLR